MKHQHKDTLILMIDKEVDKMLKGQLCTIIVGRNQDNDY